MVPVSSARCCPLCEAKLADEATNEPVCSQTRTGADAVSDAFDTQMFSLRQSSKPIGVPDVIDGQLGGGVIAGSGVDHDAGGCGAFHRLFPAGEAA